MPIRDTEISFNEDNFCEQDLLITCEGDCKACPNFKYFKIWDLMKPMAGSRPDFIVVEVTRKEENVCSV